MAVAITGTPTAKPTNLAWSRSGKTFTLTWEATEQDATDENNSSRVENTHVYICFERLGMGNTWIYRKFDGIGGECTYTFGDEKYLEDRAKKILNDSYIFFSNTHDNGSQVKLPEVSFTTPTAPTPTINYDYTTGAVTFKIEGSEAVFKAPRSNYSMTAYRAGVINGSGVSKTTVLPTTKCLGWDSNTEYTYSKEITEEAKLAQQGDYIFYTLDAQALGMASSSSQKTAYLRIQWPEAPVIQGFYKTTSGANVLVAPKKTITGIDRANVTYQLQVQCGSTAESGWENIGEEFESTVVSLPLEDADIHPEAGQHVYIRVVATYFGRSTPSSYWQVDDKYYYCANPSYSTTDDVRVEKVTPNDDTTSINLVLSYALDNSYNATLLTYSTDAYAWKSTKEPETFEMPDSKWQDAESQSSYTDYLSSSITLADLEEDTTYYLRARRYNTADTNITSLYSEMVSCNTSQTGLGAVVLSAPASAVINQKVKFTWTMPTLPDGYVVKQWVLKDNGSGIASGKYGTSCEYTFTKTKNHPCLIEITVYNRDTGGATSTLKSEYTTVEVINDPTLVFAISPPTTLTTLPLSFKIGSGDASAKIQVNILNETGTKRIMPNGAEEQCAGDIVYSQTGYGSVTCSINDGTNFWNNGQYIIQAVATDEGIQSNTLTRRFNVNYSAKLSAPTRDNVKITPVGKAVNIAVKNLDSDITCEIYRSTVDGRSSLITDGLTINSSQNYACDRFAPYALDGTCKYIILVKNAQNQYAYGEYEYTLKAGVLRFDWDSNSIELPYNIEISDEVDKQFEQQVYLDGTQRGSWGASVTRTATLSTDTVYIKDKAVQEKVRKLARYQGAVFVRTPLGQAYCANVDVKDISKAYNSNVMAVEFECTEIDLTSEFNAQSEIIVSSEVVV